MDKNMILIILGVVVVINFIVLLVLGKSNKKMPKAPKRREENPSVEAGDDEPKGKTEMLSMPRQRQVSQREVPQRQVSQREISQGEASVSITKDSPSLDRIPELSDQVKREIKRETAANLNISSRPVKATEFLDAEPEEKVYAVLKFIGNGSEHQFEMKKDEIFIGRDPEQCDLIIPSDEHIGRKHARVFFKAGKLYVEDLQSRNGTFIGDTKITGTAEVVSGKFRVALTEITVS